MVVLAGFTLGGLALVALSVPAVTPAEAPPQGDAAALDAWLKARPSIAKAILWQGPTETTTAYPSWTDAEKQQLAELVARTAAEQSPNLPEAPALASLPGTERAPFSR
jgi:hypothetical protein